jgi:hypothetical protein
MTFNFSGRALKYLKLASLSTYYFKTSCHESYNLLFHAGTSASINLYCVGAGDILSPNSKGLLARLKLQG